MHLQRSKPKTGPWVSWLLCSTPGLPLVTHTVSRKCLKCWDNSGPGTHVNGLVPGEHCCGGRRSQALTGGASATTSTLLPEMANTLNPNLPAEHHCNHLERSASRQASQIQLFLPIPCSKPPSYLRGKSRLWGRDNTLPLSERLH